MNPRIPADNAEGFMKKRYWLFLGVLLLVGLDWYIQAPDGRSRQLNAVLEAQASPELKTYPYHFHVLRVSGETAYLSTPRNVDVPAFKALGVMFPDINTRDPRDPAFIAAQQKLGAVQGEARAIVMAQAGIKEVRWELDRKWLGAHAIELPPR